MAARQWDGCHTLPLRSHNVKVRFAASLSLPGCVRIPSGVDGDAHADEAGAATVAREAGGQLLRAARQQHLVQELVVEPAERAGRGQGTAQQGAIATHPIAHPSQ